MNILILTREYKNDKLPPCGGTGIFNTLLAKELVKRGHQVTVFGVNKTNIDFDDEGVRVHYTKNLFKRNFVYDLIRSITQKFSFLMPYHFKIHEKEKRDISRRLFAYIEKNNLAVDIIECHDFEGLSLFLGKKFPYVVRCHGSFSVLEKYFGYKVEAGRKHCEREAFKKARNVIAISRFSEQINRELFGVSRFKLIYNGINIQEFQPDPNPSIIPFSIFYLGNVSLEKGADTAFRVFARLAAKFPQATLQFVGRETPYKAVLDKEIQAQDLTDKVIFHGYQSKENIIRLLNSAHVGIFPSKGETLGLALLEAMALAKPVVASNLDSFKELITSGENGYICDTDADFVTHISDLLTDTTLAETLSQKARKTVVDHFSIEKMMTETLEYYTTIIQNHN
ncbi:glycosyltransferase family 4 protein [Flavobacterium supellecticarium]|uniref:Glycosyltransferase family 4 protein n=1 Tax=Flavobacterium supellecticarium TaxID=2565924 RepID=A0A4S4A129_9FLAO|nr:glycosyltransferase family 4 protein [Flavobacterium supellecticarium]THF51609.1 glycosyltransferase family 4 protein [Flavobacterium supellecticarium]